MNAIDVTALKPIFLDTETTGLQNHDQIITLGIVDFDGSVLMNETFKPSVAISPGAYAAHGINESELADKPTFDSVAERLADLLKSRHVCIYNAGYDLRMIEQTAHAFGVNKLFDDIKISSTCIMEMYAEFYGEWNNYHQNYRWQRLGNAAMQCRIQTDSAQLHGAVYDAQLTRLVLLHMAEA